MQPAKIIPGQIYARRDVAKGALTRFKVTCVQTDRTGPSTMHSKSKVYGYEVDENDKAVLHVDERGMINTAERVKQIIAEADEIMGPWREYTELVERDRLAKAKAKEAKKLAEDQRLYLAGLLAGIANLSYSEESVRAAYHGVDISDRAVPAVTEALRLLMAKAGAK